MAVPPMTKTDWEEFNTLISEDTSNAAIWYCAADSPDCKVWKRPVRAASGAWRAPALGEGGGGLFFSPLRRSPARTGQDEKAPINLVRLWAIIPDVKAVLLYEMLNNHAYRKVWDENMIEGKVIEMVSPVDEVGYYAAKVSRRAHGGGGGPPAFFSGLTLTRAPVLPGPQPHQQPRLCDAPHLSRVSGRQEVWSVCCGCWGEQRSSYAGS